MQRPWDAETWRQTELAYSVRETDRKTHTHTGRLVGLFPCIGQCLISFLVHLFLHVPLLYFLPSPLPSFLQDVGPSVYGPMPVLLSRFISRQCSHCYCCLIDLHWYYSSFISRQCIHWYCCLIRLSFMLHSFDTVAWLTGFSGCLRQVSIILLSCIAYCLLFQ